MCDRIRVGVTGHRILAGTDRVVNGVRRALDRICDAHPGQPLIVLSSLAEGADRIVAEEVLRLAEGELVAVLPLPLEEYATDFGPPGSPSRIHFDALLARARRTVPAGQAASRDEGYAWAGRYVLDHSDVLIAVWDGKPAQGPGGAGEIVALARAQGLPLAWVHAGNRSPGTLEPTSLGPEQGTVTFENF